MTTKDTFVKDPEEVLQAATCVRKFLMKRVFCDLRVLPKRFEMILNITIPVATYSHRVNGPFEVIGRSQS